jgi:hypothetical protein
VNDGANTPEVGTGIEVRREEIASWTSPGPDIIWTASPNTIGIAVFLDSGGGLPLEADLISQLAAEDVTFVHTGSGLVIGANEYPAPGTTLHAPFTNGEGGFFVKKGTVCRTSASARSFILRDDVQFQATDLTKQGVVDAAAPGFEYNVPGPFTTADGTVLPGEIDRIPIPILDPLLAEPSIEVRQVADTTGGQPPVLDQIGIDRNIPRLPSENDESFKGRIRQLPDTVSPDALKRQLDAIFLVLGLEYELIETWQNKYNVGYDCPGGTPDHYAQGYAEPTFLAYDDTRTEHFQGRWMDENDSMGGLVLVVPDVGAWAERSIGYSDLPNWAETKLDVQQALTEGGFLDPGVDFPSVAPPNYQTFDDWRTKFRARDYSVEANGWTVFIACEIVGAGLSSVEVRDGERYNQDTNLWEVLDTAIGILLLVDAVTLAASITMDEFEDQVDQQSTRIRCLKDYTSGPDNLVVSFAQSGYGLALPLSDGGPDPGQATTYGRRARPAYDSLDKDSDLIYVGFFDGYDYLHNLFYLRLWNLLKQIKGGGVFHSIELKGQ